MTVQKLFTLHQNFGSSIATLGLVIFLSIAYLSTTIALRIQYEGTKTPGAGGFCHPTQCSICRICRIRCHNMHTRLCKSSFPRKYPHSILTNNSGNLSQPNSLLNCSPFRVSLRYAWVTDTLVNAIYWSHGLQQSTWSTGYPQELTTSVHLCLMPTPVHAVVSHILW